MKYTADCPSCSSEFEIAGLNEAAAGLKCPKCDVGFVPEKIRQEKSAADYERERQQELENQEWRELSDLMNNAQKCFTTAMLFTFLAALCLLGAVFSLNALFIAASGGCFSIALVLFSFFAMPAHSRRNPKSCSSRSERGAQLDKNSDSCLTLAGPQSELL